MPHMEVELQQYIPAATRHGIKACLLSLKEVSRLKRNVETLLQSFGNSFIDVVYLTYSFCFMKTALKHYTSLIFHTSNFWGNIPKGKGGISFAILQQATVVGLKISLKNIE